MEKQIIHFLIALCFLFSIFSCERDNNVIEYREVSVIINHTDTIYVYIEKDPRIEDLFIDILKDKLGTRELTGNNDGEVVKAILANCGINFPAPWCACFIHDGLKRLGTEGGPEKDPGWTPNWFKDPNRITWVRDRDSYKITFQKGWIGAIYYRSKGRIGHIFAIVEDTTDGYVITIEGNTDSAGSREGNGVFIRIRHKKEIYMMANWLLQNKINGN